MGRTRSPLGRGAGRIRPQIDRSHSENTARLAASSPRQPWLPRPTNSMTRRPKPRPRPEHPALGLQQGPCGWRTRCAGLLTRRGRGLGPARHGIRGRGSQAASEKLAAQRGVFSRVGSGRSGGGLRPAPAGPKGERVRPMRRLRNCKPHHRRAHRHISSSPAARRASNPLFAVAFMAEPGGRGSCPIGRTRSFVAIAKQEGMVLPRTMP